VLLKDPNSWLGQYLGYAESVKHPRNAWSAEYSLSWKSKDQREEFSKVKGLKGKAPRGATRKMEEDPDFIMSWTVLGPDKVALDKAGRLTAQSKRCLEDEMPEKLLQEFPPPAANGKGKKSMRRNSVS
jgi:hypothetical protein